MSNESMLPSKLSRHLESKHPHLQGKDLSYFNRLLEQNRKQASTFKSKMTVSKKAQIASLEISEMIAQNLKSHTLAESIILPACRKMVKTMLEDEAEKEIKKIPSSNDTVRRHILALSADIKENVCHNKLKNSIFALQVDESTDITNKAYLLAFIRFIDSDQIVNQFLCCKEMPGTTKGEDIFQILINYLLKWDLPRKSCIGICTDGAPSMVGSLKGFKTLVKERQNPNIITTHCFLHREALVAKTLGDELKEVLNQVTEMVNFIKRRPLKCRLFKQICIEMDSQHKRLLLHSEARWLSRGKVLCRVHELRKELLLFFDEMNHKVFSEYLKSEFWISGLAYLVDIFQHLNNLNRSMQGKNENILTSTDKLSAFQKKLSIWKRNYINRNFEMFPSLSKTHVKEMMPIIVDHLTILQEKLRFYFPSLNVDHYDWIRNPFMETPTAAGLILAKELSLEKFWISIKEEYPSTARKALSILIQFSTSYLCELGFSSLTNIKCKKRQNIQ